MIAGEAPLRSTVWQMQRIHTLQQEEDVEIKDHLLRCLAPEALPRLERVNDTESDRSDDSAGEKEAKRQRSEPTTPVSTSSRLPYEYDALMGITRVGTKEAEGFDEELGTPEYHDASEEPTKREGTDDLQQEPRSTGFQGGYGSSSLKECIDLLNAKPRNTPAPLDSGVDQDSVSPPHS